MNEQVTKHTPGPWEMMPPLGEGNYSVMSSKVNAGGNWYVAEIPNGSHAEAQANARLIAAAPELLDALRLVLAHDGALTGADWTAIRAAIAKAEGVA